MTEKKWPSAFARAIAAGEADPITPEERELVAILRRRFEERFGKDFGSDVTGDFEAKPRRMTRSERKRRARKSA
ncbi:hypothetical protein MF406_17100 [Georgenia sp. TF02-10]|uniref:hypothetical protein n=1 Tax=Georgenia sp. TF02-10 TaxID=2917725 RepID=UPI001FA7B74C|nr:hypothetical protein [Georgenia sp. TF02-10]UNX54574.1 hypothetical protein MF406_17100 [Georgenia sp. TF02-10]